MQALEAQPESVGAKAVETWAKLNTFMKQRLSALLEERAYKFDEIDAVLTAGLGDVGDILNRLKALHELRKRSEFEPLAVSFKRGMNIVRQAAKAATMDGNLTIQTELLKEPCEQVLFQVLETAGSQVSAHIQIGAYREALESMVPLREPLDGFFNGVMVMAEDPALKTNRLALMKRLVSLFEKIADFSKLQNA